MFDSLLRKIGDQGNDGVQRRRYVRRAQDHCIAEVIGRAFPVENWSLGGVQIFADDKHFGLGEKLEIVLKFRLEGRILTVKQQAEVVRKGVHKVSFKYKKLLPENRDLFQTVLDDAVANQY